MKNKKHMISKMIRPLLAALIILIVGVADASLQNEESTKQVILEASPVECSTNLAETLEMSVEECSKLMNEGRLAAEKFMRRLDAVMSMLFNVDKLDSRDVTAHDRQTILIFAKKLKGSIDDSATPSGKMADLINYSDIKNVRSELQQNPQLTGELHELLRKTLGLD